MRKLAVRGLLSVAIFLLVIAGLIGFDRPVTLPANGDGGLDFSAVAAASTPTAPPQARFRARDGRELAFRHYPNAGPGSRRLYLIHGSGWHGLQFDELARWVAENGLADVFVPDLRGHGFDPVRRGDIDYIGQLEDDLSDLISATDDGSGGPVLLAGHSSGGGLVVRFAGGAHGRMADGFILLAPFLKYNAPTTRPDSGGWARPLTLRIIGLTMLNAIGITGLNHLPVIQFNMPRSVLDGPLGDTATTAYSFRLNTGYAPRSDFQKDLRAIDRPLLVLAGSADEAFVADQYEAVISAETGSGTYVVLPGIGHLGIVNAPETRRTIARWLQENRL